MAEVGGGGGWSLAFFLSSNGRIINDSGNSHFPSVCIRLLKLSLPPPGKLCRHETQDNELAPPTPRV